MHCTLWKNEQKCLEWVKISKIILLSMHVYIMRIYLTTCIWIWKHIKFNSILNNPKYFIFKIFETSFISWTKLHVTLLLGEIKTAQKNDRFLNLLRFFPPEVTTPMLTIYAEENWRKWHLHAIIFREHIISSNGSSVLYRVQYTSCCCVIGLYDNKNHHIHIFINT